MNWGRLKFAPDAPELADFIAVLDDEYARAEPGFEEAMERLAHLRSSGPSGEAFDFNSADRLTAMN